MNQKMFVVGVILTALIALGGCLKHRESPGAAPASGNIPPAAPSHEGMVLVPAGEFMMGCNEPLEYICNTPNKPYHKVYLDAFYIDKFEATVQQYRACVQAGKCSVNPEASEDLGCNWAISGNENHPINCENWNQADAYCKWAGKRLPTEAEWEKAARGTDGRMYPWGNQNPSCDYAVYEPRLNDESPDLPIAGCGKRSTWPVGSKPAGASPYGAMDMAGNVGEWVGDLYGANYYSSGPNRNPTGPESGQERIVRGGGWTGGDEYIRTSYRSLAHTTGWENAIGFRCAMGTTPPQMPPTQAQPQPPAIQVKPGEMVTVPAGEFTMGSTSEQIETALDQCYKFTGESCSRGGGVYEQPQHKVYLDEFQIDRYEVTIGPYLACVKEGKCSMPDSSNNCQWGEILPDNDNYPVSCVNWNQADAFCKWDGKRLPTEAEWEKAARGTDGRIYPWGNEQATCNYAVMYDLGDDGCGRETSIWPVGSKPAGASPYGAMDMAGNMSEWVADWYDEEYYSSSPNRNPTGPKSGTKRVYRGGDWGSGPLQQRAATRGGTAPNEHYSMFGFRCAKGKMGENGGRPRFPRFPPGFRCAKGK